MAFTENYAIFNDFPLFWDGELLAKNIHAPKFHRDMPSRFAVIPRRGSTGQIRWFEAEATYDPALRNAYEDGHEIVLDGFFQGDPEPEDIPRGERVAARLPLPRPRPAAGPAAPRRLDLNTGLVKEQQLTDTITEFGMLNGRYAGRGYRYAYAATRRRAGSSSTAWSATT